MLKSGPFWETYGLLHPIQALVFPNPISVPMSDTHVWSRICTMAGV